jgi:hypothetical protein
MREPFIVHARDLPGVVVETRWRDPGHHEIEDGAEGPDLGGAGPWGCVFVYFLLS